MKKKRNNSGRSVEYSKYHLIRELESFGYKEDNFGKRTTDMTLPELEQIHINLESKQP